MQRSSSSSLRLACVALAVMAAGMACMLPIPVGIPGTGGPTSTPVLEAPHAPPIKINTKSPLFDEQVRLVTVKSGEKVSFLIKDLWSAPLGTQVSCATGFLAYTWQVRDPYPQGGEDLQIQHLVPQGGGQTEVANQGSTGAGTLGYCDEMILYNNSLKDYRVEIRYASGNGP